MRFHTSTRNTNLELLLKENISCNCYILDFCLRQDCSTDFEFLPIDVSLLRCERYFYKITNPSGSVGLQPNIVGTRFTVNELFFGIPCPVPLRATPSVTKSGTMYIYNAGTSTTLGSIIAVVANYNTFSTTPNVRITATGVSLSTSYTLEYDVNASFEISAEL